MNRNVASLALSLRDGTQENLALVINDAPQIGHLATQFLKISRQRAFFIARRLAHSAIQYRIYPSLLRTRPQQFKTAYLFGANLQPDRYSAYPSGLHLCTAESVLVRQNPPSFLGQPKTELTHKLNGITRKLNGTPSWHRVDKNINHYAKEY